jgi:hypothetical protein
MNFDMSWGAPFVQAPEPMKPGLSLEHMEKHIIEWTVRSQNCGYHTGLSTQVHMLLLQEPLDKMIQVLDSMRARKQVNLYYCGPMRALWVIPGVSRMAEADKSYGSHAGFTWSQVREEAIRQATEYPGKASNGHDLPNHHEMDVTLRILDLPRRATGRMTDSTCVYCA